jgi:hypothetical protein
MVGTGLRLRPTGRTPASARIRDRATGSTALYLVSRDLLSIYAFFRSCIVCVF